MTELCFTGFAPGEQSSWGESFFTVQAGKAAASRRTPN